MNDYKSQLKNPFPERFDRAHSLCHDIIHNRLGRIHPVAEILGKAFVTVGIALLFFVFFRGLELGGEQFIDNFGPFVVSIASTGAIIGLYFFIQSCRFDEYWNKTPLWVTEQVADELIELVADISPESLVPEHLLLRADEYGVDRATVLADLNGSIVRLKNSCRRLAPKLVSADSHDRSVAMKFLLRDADVSGDSLSYSLEVIDRHIAAFPEVVESQIAEHSVNQRLSARLPRKSDGQHEEGPALAYRPSASLETLTRTFAALQASDVDLTLRGDPEVVTQKLAENLQTVYGPFSRPDVMDDLRQWVASLAPPANQ